ncbi:MAG: nicotinamide riboside transporter PnuC [Clostridia bacterium]
MNIIKSFKNLTKFELVLWGASLVTVVLSSMCGGLKNVLTMTASLIGVTALIFVAKGDAFGQLLTVIFSLFYGFISYRFHYYGEMITYMCMTAPIAGMAFMSWLRNPFEQGKQEVKVNHLEGGEIAVLCAATAAVTVLFYFILAFFGTVNLIPSTVSVSTSFLASYLTFRRSEFYALAYAANDIVLIVLWVFAAISDIGYLSMAACFVMFFVNDMYGFINWSRMKKRQKTETEKAV